MCRVGNCAAPAAFPVWEYAVPFVKAAVGARTMGVSLSITRP